MRVAVVGCLNLQHYDNKFILRTETLNENMK